MKMLLAVAALVVLCLPASARAQDVVPPFTATLRDTLKLKITAIDAAARVVTLRGAKGDTMSVLCGPEVVNFDQLRVGDMVQTVYNETLDIAVKADGKFEKTTESSSSRAKKGAKPGAMFWERTTNQAKITEINKEAGYATLETIDGELFTVIPDQPENLAKVQVGNFVVVTRTVTRAISVNKAAATKTTTTKTGTKTTTKTTTTK